MRVLHVIPGLGPEVGGPSYSVPGLCRALKSVGVDVELYTLRRPGAPVTVSSDDAYLYPHIRWFTPVKGSSYLPTISFYHEIIRDIRQFDLVHVHSIWNPTSSLTALACRKARVPYLVSPRGMLQEHALRRRKHLKKIYFRFIENHTLESARALHFLTDAEASDSQCLLNARIPSVIIPNGVDPSLSEACVPGHFRREFPELEGKRIMLFLGRLHWSKGLALQAEALAQVAKTTPHLMWVLVGSDAGEWNHLSRLISTLGIESQVLWTGPLSWNRGIEALLDADLVVLTSLHEAHSMAMNEALAVGVPIIVTETVQFSLIKEWGAGYIVPRSAERLAAAILDILECAEQSEKMRDAGRQLASQYLAWPKIAGLMTTAYENLISSSMNHSCPR